MNVNNISIASEVHAAIPETLAGVTDRAWLSAVLAPISQGRKVATVELADVVKAMAAKVRVVVVFEGRPERIEALCVKGFLDHDLGTNAGGLTTLREADFYLKIAPELSMRTPPCRVVVTNRDEAQCVFIMDDMITAGAHFYNALEPFNVDQVAETLDQIARLHASARLLEVNDWIPCRIQDLAERGGHITVEKMQSLMHDERRADLPAETLDAARLIEGIRAMAQRNRSLPQTLLHGDVHPGNIYRDAGGALAFTDWQLIQRGHWSLDVAYHIASVLPVELAERNERQLLRHYLAALRKHGGDVPDDEVAWLDYRCAHVYGFYQWAITQRVHPPITHQAFLRLGAAVTRHQSYRLLGLAPFA